MAEPQTKTKDEWSPHIWNGSDLFAWLRLVTKGRCAVGFKQLHLLPVGLLLNLSHTFLGYAQSHLYRQRLREAPPPKAPLFILGHWRTGTTLLHELLIRDPRHHSPDTYQCFSPCEFLLTQRFAKKYLNWLLPAKRMMDNMPVGWDRPQEDEFALALLGAPSPYNSWAFPNQAKFEPKSLDIDGLPKPQRDLWKRTLLKFVQAISLGDSRRLIMKSPTHTCRIPVLLELFPDARFIYLTRDPYVVFSSTLNLWKTLYRKQGYHTPDYRGLEERVYGTFTHMARRVEATRHLVPPSRFVELKYEELTRDTLGQMRQLYAQLELGDFENIRENLQQYLAANARYEKNKWTLSEAQRTEIRKNWGETIRQWGYEV